MRAVPALVGHVRLQVRARDGIGGAPQDPASRPPERLERALGRVGA